VQCGEPARKVAVARGIAGQPSQISFLWGNAGKGGPRGKGLEGVGPCSEKKHGEEREGRQATCNGEKVPACYRTQWR